jgi:hypothetical protein
MLGAPQDDHAFEDTGAGTACADEQIQQRSRDGRGAFLSQRQCVLGRRDLEELHLASHVVQRRNEQVHGPVHGMELRVLSLG